MLVNVDVVLKNLQGESLKDTNAQGEVIEATVKLALINAILAPTKAQESGMDKVKKYELAKRIYASSEVDLDIEEIKLIKDCVSAIYPALITGQIFEMLQV